MPETSYVVAVLVIGFVITVSLRALPFAVLAPLRRSRAVAAVSVWMPVGILAILAAQTFRSTVAVDVGGGPWLSAPLLHGLLAVAVTVAVHLSTGRRTLLSVGLGTLTYVLLVNLA
ncbi:MAG: AzlD domain-containing protein [Actinomycetaceae bacterium]